MNESDFKKINEIHKELAYKVFEDIEHYHANFTKEERINGQMMFLGRLVKTYIDFFNVETGKSKYKLLDIFKDIILRRIEMDITIKEDVPNHNNIIEVNCYYCNKRIKRHLQSNMLVCCSQECEDKYKSICK